MSKIYEALENAKKERAEPGEFSFGSMSEKPDSKISKLKMEDEMLRLCHNINNLLPDLQSKVIQFISSSEGEGSSTIVQEFGTVVSLKLGLSVLLLEANFQINQASFFGIEFNGGWDEVIRDGRSIKEVLYQIGKSRLYISPLSMKRDSMATIFHSPRIEEFFKILKKKFDYILVDSSPVNVTSDGIELSHKVDGVVMVVEAEKTRWQVASSVKDKIQERGGNILGVILNKKKYYIPPFIYKLL